MNGRFLVSIAVHNGGRVAALAGPNEILVPSTVRDLVGRGEDGATQPTATAIGGPS